MKQGTQETKWAIFHYSDSQYFSLATIESGSILENAQNVFEFWNVYKESNFYKIFRVFPKEIKIEKTGHDLMEA